jgi:hypothetical protein
MLVAGGFIGLEVGLKFALRLGARQKHAIGLTIHRYRVGISFEPLDLRTKSGMSKFLRVRLHFWYG